MVHVVQLTSLARVARRCVRAVRDSTLLLPAINANSIHHQQLHQFHLGTVYSCAKQFLRQNLILRTIDEVDLRWEATVLERFQQICFICSQRSCRTDSTLIRCTVASRVASRSPTRAQSVRSTGDYLVISHQVRTLAEVLSESPMTVRSKVAVAKTCRCLSKT